MSEHEGFCIPLLEAMINKVPVVALNSTGIPFTLGDAGILVNDKDPRLVAQLVNIVCERQEYREQIIAKQLRQANVWHPKIATAKFRAWLNSVITQ